MSDAEAFGSPSMWARMREALSGRRRPEGAKAPALAEAVGEMRSTINSRIVRSQRLEEAFAVAWTHCRARKVSLSLLVIEVDRYRDYHRAYGQGAAESCIEAVKTALAGIMPRPDDFFGRQGQNVFVAMLPDYPLLMARSTAQRMAAAVQDAAFPHKESHRGIVTVSVGVAVTNPVGAPDRSFLTVAQAALEKAKSRGLGRMESVDRRAVEDAARLAG